METEISKTQIDRLGDRLRKGNITDSDLRLLDEYRLSFTVAYGIVAEGIRGQLNLEPTGRPAKSTTSIAEKLRRESIRLSQIQDIAGCRLIVSDTAEQDRVVVSLIELFRDNNIVDRRQTPSHGYRAVHVITRVNNKWVEIQIRTALQQLWAELSEKLSDLIDPAIKYGGGDDRVKRVLATASELVALQEDNELKLLALQQARPSFKSNTDMTQDTSEGTIDQQSELDHLREAIMNSRNRTIEIFQDFIKN